MRLRNSDWLVIVVLLACPAATTGDEIDDLCRERWTNDFVMREYCVTEQRAAKNRLLQNARCELPKLLVIPPEDRIAGRERDLFVAANTYFTAIQAYSACLQAELMAAGGDQAPDLVKRVLVTRGNAAVDEANLMMKLFTQRVRPAETAGPAPSSANP